MRVASSEWATSTRIPNSPWSVSQRLLKSIEAEGFTRSAKSPRLTLKDRPKRLPSKSSGMKVRRSTVPPRPPSIMSAFWFLYTSTPAISSDGTSWKLSARPPEAEKLSRPLSSERTWVRPRTATPLPSAEKCSGSPTDRKRSMVTPGIRESVSVTLRSGSAPISSAVTESTKVSASRLMSWARKTEPRMPLTTTLSSSTGSAGAPASWAWAVAASMAATPSARARRRSRTNGSVAPFPAYGRWRSIGMAVPPTGT